MARKDKVQIYIPIRNDWDKLVERVVELRESEGMVYTPWQGLEYTASEVVIDAMKELVKRIERDQAEK